MCRWPPSPPASSSSAHNRTDLPNHPRSQPLHSPANMQHTGHSLGIDPRCPDTRPHRVIADPRRRARDRRRLLEAEIDSAPGT